MRTGVVHQDQAIGIDLRQKAANFPFADGISLSLKKRSMVPSTFISRLDSLRSSIHSASPEAWIRCFRILVNLRIELAGDDPPASVGFQPLAIQRVLMPLKVPVSTTSSGLIVVRQCAGIRAPRPRRSWNRTCASAPDADIRSGAMIFGL